MKNYFTIILLSLILFIHSSCKDSKGTPCRDTIVDTRCKDTCTIQNDYCELDKFITKDSYELAAADIRIESFTVTKPDDAHLQLYVRVINNNDDDAHEAKLIILLPADVCSIAVVKIDPLIKHHVQCGGYYEFCLGDLATSGEGSIREVTIQTSLAKLPQMEATESFAGFVYSSTPDPCPTNNYRSWVNHASVCLAIDVNTIFQRGFPK